MDLLSSSHERLALICLDLQIAFISPDGASKNNTMDGPIEAINKLSATFRRFERPVIHSRYVFEPDLADIGLLAAIPLIHDGFVCDGHPEAALDPRVDVPEGDLHHTHNRPSAFFNSALADLLKAHEIDAIVVCGVSTNNAVSATAFDAFSLDIPIVIASDAVGAAPYEPASPVYLDVLDRWTAQIMTVDEICALVAERAAVPATVDQ